MPTLQLFRKKMGWKRLGDGGGRDEQKLFGWSICSAAASAVNLNAWTHTDTPALTWMHTYLQCQQLAGPTLLCGSSINNLCSRSASLWFLCWSRTRRRKVLLALRSAAVCASAYATRGRVRGGERGRESQRGSFLLRWYVRMMHQCRPRPHRKHSQSSRGLRAA